MTNVPIIDQPRWPAMDAETIPAFMDFKLVLKATDEAVKYEDAARQYRFDGFKAVEQLEAALRMKLDTADAQQAQQTLAKVN